MSMKKGGGRVLFSQGFLRDAARACAGEKSVQVMSESGRGGTTTPDIAGSVSLPNW
jgi:hypothetical protein